MKADLDFDIVAHFGFFRNVDLLSKGLYVVQVKLYYGLEGNLIAPVGMFSSPSTVCSVVQEQTLPPAPVSSMCEVDDQSRCFRTRSIVIRYRDERYELNDGAHWRLTLPACDVSYAAAGHPPHCEKLLHLKFDLLYAPFMTLPPDVKVDLMTEVHKLIPDDPLYSIVATQNLVIKQAGSGIHSYYPVHFGGSNIVELDCMVHCAVTGIRFPSLAPKPVASPASTSADAAPAADMSHTDRPLPDAPSENPADAKESSERAAAPVTPVKSRKEAETDQTTDSGVQARDLGASSGSGAGGDVFVTPSKRGSQRYVPSVSPHSTVLLTPGAEEDSTPAQNAMQRMSGRLGNWRRSITTLASPVPLLEKVSDVGVASARKLSAFTSVLGSPIAGAAAILRMDTVYGGTTTIQDAAGLADPAAGAENAEQSSMLDSTAAAIAAESPSSDNAAAGPASAIDDAQKRDEAIVESLVERSLPVDAAELSSPQLDPILDPEGWLEAHARAAISNYNSVHAGIRSIIDLYALVQASEENGAAPAGSSAALPQADALSARCGLETQRSEILVEILLSADEGERAAVLKEKVDLCNQHVTLHWSLLMTALRRVMPQLCPVLKQEYREASRVFWRGQLLMHTRSLAETTCYQATEAQLLLDVVDNLISREVAAAAGHSGSAVAPTRLSVQHIYDFDLLKSVLKLPHMVLQQYIDGQDAATPSLAQLNAELARGKEGAGPSAEATDPSTLNLRVQAARSLAEQNKAFPVGTVLLARGGELLGETHSERRPLLPRDGQVLDLENYPTLKPVPLQVRETTDPALSTKPSADSPVGEETASLNIRDIELEGTSDTTNSGAPRAAKGPAETAQENPISPPDFVAAYQRHRARPPSRYVHLVVLQHGFLGQSYDMHLIENAIRLDFPGTVETFVARSNEGKEHDSIAQMGKRLAFELIQYCKEYHPDLLKPGSKPRLSFIGHSMGGLIIRQALHEPAMKPLFSKLHAYVSLATPHVGSLFPDSQIVSTGMWALFKWKKYKALKELVLEDTLGGKVSKTLLYKLSENNVLCHFRKVVLVSSPKDQYVPVFSARIQTCPKSDADAVLGAAVKQMVHNILQPLRADQLVRISLDNNVGESVDVNSLIGRTAHICYLDNPIAAKLLVYAIAAYLD